MTVGRVPDGTDKCWTCDICHWVTLSIYAATAHEVVRGHAVNQLPWPLTGDDA